MATALSVVCLSMGTAGIVYVQELEGKETVFQDEPDYVFEGNIGMKHRSREVHRVLPVNREVKFKIRYRRWFYMDNKRLLHRRWVKEKKLCRKNT